MTPTRPLPCVHLGPVVERATCNCRRKDTYACAAGVNNGRVVPLANCEGCAKYAADAPRADLFGDEPFELWPGFPDPLPERFVPNRPDGWWKDEGVRKRHVEAFKAALTLKPEPATWTREAGIVTAGGGSFYWPQAVVLVRTLREAGCSLPIEVWHAGDREPVNLKDVEGLGVEVCDSLATGEMLGDNRLGPAVQGWSNKIYGLVHSSFRRALFLDADVYAVADPTPLFPLIDGVGFGYWQDVMGAEKHINWVAVWPAGRRIRGRDNKIPPIQGGQLLIDRSDPGAWRTLLLTHHMCQHQDYYFGHNLIYGDQDAFRVALAAGGGKYRCIGPAEWQSPAFVCRHDGTVYFVHRCAKKFQLDNLPGAARALHHFSAACNSLPWGTTGEPPCPPLSPSAAESGTPQPPPAAGAPANPAGSS